MNNLDWQLTEYWREQEEQILREQTGDIDIYGCDTTPRRPKCPRKR
jgi:hypothetical protein